MSAPSPRYAPDYRHQVHVDLRRDYLATRARMVNDQAVLAAHHSCAECREILDAHPHVLLSVSPAGLAQQGLVRLLLPWLRANGIDPMDVSADRTLYLERTAEAGMRIRYGEIQRGPEGRPLAETTAGRYGRPLLRGRVVAQAAELGAVLKAEWLHAL